MRQQTPKSLRRTPRSAWSPSLFDVPLDEIDDFSFEAPPERPNGVHVRLLLKSSETREHLAKNDDAWTCAVETAGIA